MGLADYLKNNFLDSQNRPDWSGLAGAIVGATLLAVLEGAVGLAQAVGQSIKNVLYGITNGFYIGVNTFNRFVGGIGSPDAISAGALSLPVTLAIVLVGLFLIARGTEVI
jgi:hypothetical protein